MQLQAFDCAQVFLFFKDNLYTFVLAFSLLHRDPEVPEEIQDQNSWGN
jgi:hypothetical protein